MFSSLRTHHLLILIAVLTLGVYGYAAFTNDFVGFDDPVLIYGNVAVQQFSWNSFVHIFSSYDPELYIPLTLLTFQIEYAIAGANPIIFHITNLLLHTANALLVFSFVYLFLEKRSLALITALLFAIHPINTEAVMWASARKDLLSMFFLLGSLNCYVQYTKYRETRWYNLSVVAFLLCLLSKVSAALLPLILLMIDYVHARSFSLRTWLEKIPFFLFSIIFIIVAILGKTQNLEGVTLLETLLLGAKSTWLYITSFLLPLHLVVTYPQLTPIELLRAEFFLPLLGCIALVACTVTFFFQKRFRIITFSLTTFAVLLAPNFTNVLKNGLLFFASDRYIYMASIGAFLIIALGIDFLFSKAKQSAFIGTTCIVIILTALSFQQSLVWKNTGTLFRNVLRVYPNYALAHNNVGAALLKEEHTEEALVYYKRAAELDPGYVQAHVNVGTVLQKQGYFSDAEQKYRDAIAAIGTSYPAKPDDLNAYYQLGQLLEDQGRTEEAFMQLTAAAEMDLDSPEAAFNLGMMHHKYSQFPEAEKWLLVAIEKGPRYTAARYHLASILANQGRLDEAIEQLEAIMKIDAQYEKTQMHLENLQRIVTQ